MKDRHCFRCGWDYVYGPLHICKRCTRELKARGYFRTEDEWRELYKDKEAHQRHFEQATQPRWFEK